MDADPPLAAGSAPLHGSDGSEPAELVFERHRSFLFSLAYRMLGSVADAEDAVQDSYLRWQGAARERVAAPREYLGRIVVRLCLDYLKSARVRRESYVGPWLPEPLLGVHEEDPLESIERSRSLSTAFLLLLERLSPTERAAFLLREVFAFEYAALARILERSEAACRQIVRRARTRVAAGEPRFTATAAEAERLATLFLEACAGGQVEELSALLAPSAALWADGGGQARAARNVIRGSDPIARFFVGIFRKWPRLRMQIARINGQPGVITRTEDGAIQVTTFAIDQGRIHGVFIVTNPEKLRHIVAADREPSALAAVARAREREGSDTSAAL